MTKEQQSIFLIQEFENMLSEINCPIEYIMDLFVKEIMRDDYVIEKVKVQYRKRKNVRVTYRGLLFLLERFEIFMNVVLFKQIIQDNIAKNIPEVIFL